MRKTSGHDAHSSRHDAATLFNSLDRKFHFPLNRDTLTSHVLYNGRKVWGYKRCGPLEDPNHPYFSLHGATIVNRFEVEVDD